MKFSKWTVKKNDNNFFEYSCAQIYDNTKQAQTFKIQINNLTKKSFKSYSEIVNKLNEQW